MVATVRDRDLHRVGVRLVRLRSDVCDVAGEGHARIDIGGDFDGITEVVEGLEDVSTYPALFAELARRGWSDSDLSKLAGENFLRVFAQAEAVAKKLQKKQ